MNRKSVFWLIWLAALGLPLGGCNTSTPAPTQPPPSTPIVDPTTTARPTATPTSTPQPLRIVGYYAAWAPERQEFLSGIRADQLTHVNYAFGNVSAEGQCILGDPAADVDRPFSAGESVSGQADPSAAGTLRGNFNQLQELKQKYPGLQTLISIGGWSWSDHFSDAALSEASRQAFAESCIQLFLKQYPGVFDGLDIDWEYPVSGGLSDGRPEDKHNFTLLLAELRRQLDALGEADGRHYLLTIAAPAGAGSYQNFERGDLIKYLDWVNVMAYDFHGVWETTTNFNAPLYQSSSEQEPSLNGDAAIKSYLEAGIPAGQLVFGVPFYGHGWQGVPNSHDGLYQEAGLGAAPGSWGEAGAFDYKELKQKYLPTYSRFWNDEARVPWLYNPFTGIFISYDDPQSLIAKAGYVLDHGLGGIMIWELSQDDGSLLNTIYSRLYGASSAALEATPTPFTVARTDQPGTGTFFDDFNYSGPDDPRLRANDWTARTEPADAQTLAGAAWSADGLAVVADPDSARNRLLQVSASTGGTAENTTQAGLYQVRKFFEGTYAGRVRFVNAGASGSGGDQVVETFTALTPLTTSGDPDYGELDFAYLPLGGPGSRQPTLWLNTWETVTTDPWTPDRLAKPIGGSLEGWHTLVMQVAGGTVKYYLDGILKAAHGDKYYPETPLAVEFGAWFLDGGVAGAAEPRSYAEQVDWFYYAGGATLAPEEVEARVDSFRAASSVFEDRVLAWIPVAAEAAATPVPARVAGAPRPFEKELHSVSGITIDGRLNDWPGDPTFAFADGSQVVYEVTHGSWGGPQDFSAQAWAGWAAEGLYFAFKVTDDKHVQSWSGPALWHGDYMELQIDTQLEKDYDSTDMNDDDYQIGLSPGDFSGLAPEATVWFGPVTAGALSQVQVAGAKTGDGYVLEAFVPRELLQGISLSQGATLGMNINPSDTDDSQQGQKVMLSTSETRKLTDPTTFGKITLVH